MTAHLPEPGDEVIDSPTGLPAVVQDVEQDTVWLRRLEGGVEWTRHRRDVQLAPVPEAAT